MNCFVLRVDGVLCVGQSLAWAILLCCLLSVYGAETGVAAPLGWGATARRSRRSARAASPPLRPALRAYVRRTIPGCFINPPRPHCPTKPCQLV